MGEGCGTMGGGGKCRMEACGGCGGALDCALWGGCNVFDVSVDRAAVGMVLVAVVPRSGVVCGGGE